jgi:hypothetical protein
VYLLQEENNAMHLNPTEYEDSINPKKLILKSQSNQEFLSSSQYRMFVDALQAKMKNKYVLRLTKKSVIQDSQP